MKLVKLPSTAPATVKVSVITIKSQSTIGRSAYGCLRAEACTQLAIDPPKTAGITTGDTRSWVVAQHTYQTLERSM